MHVVNTTKEVLAPGTISVIEGGFYCNQSQFVPMIPGDEGIIPYGSDTTNAISRYLYYLLF